jgi:hypothetical protein
MATNNMRIVGYLPPTYHQKLREYMEQESLTESAALVKIVKQFFDGSTGTKAPSVAKEKDDALAEFKADIAELKQRLMVLEQAVASGKQRPFRSKTSQKQRAQTLLPPQSCADLARRLGVSPDSLEEAYQKGSAYFQDWCKRRDPSQRAWQKRGELFYPLSD